MRAFITMLERLRRRDDGFSTMSLLIYIAVGAILIAVIATTFIMMNNKQRDAMAERAQTAAVQAALQEIAHRG